MAERYFAYGSNLKLSRLRERAPSARPEGVARLAGYRLVFDKRGADDTGKANLRSDPAALVWGVIYRLDAGDWSSLDRHEPDYARLEVRPSCCDEVRVAQTYLSTHTTRDPVPADWYRRLVVEGAREQGLPADWIRWLESV